MDKCMHCHVCACNVNGKPHSHESAIRYVSCVLWYERKFIIFWNLKNQIKLFKLKYGIEALNLKGIHMIMNNTGICSPRLM